MPDLKSELSKVIKAWDAEPTPTTMTTPHRFQTTNNVSRITFDFARDNFGLTRSEIATALEEQGHNRKSTTSLLGQMIMSGMLREDENKHVIACQDEYTPIKPGLIKKARAKAKRASKKVAPAPVVEPVQAVTPEWTVESVIGSLNVRQAMAVYMELRALFGG
jgi:hypothetical protein